MTAVHFTDGMLEVSAVNELTKSIEVKPLGDSISLCMTIRQAESLIVLLRQAIAQAREFESAPPQLENQAQHGQANQD